MIRKEHWELYDFGEPPDDLGETCLNLGALAMMGTSSNKQIDKSQEPGHDRGNIYNAVLFLQVSFFFPKKHTWAIGTKTGHDSLGLRGEKKVFGVL